MHDQSMEAPLTKCPRKLPSGSRSLLKYILISADESSSLFPVPYSLPNAPNNELMIHSSDTVYIQMDLPSDL